MKAQNDDFISIEEEVFEPNLKSVTLKKEGKPNISICGYGDFMDDFIADILRELEDDEAR